MSKGKVEVKIVCDTVAEIGEGAIWDYKNNRLLWIDTQGSFFIYTPKDGKNKEIKLEKAVATVIVPCEKNLIIVALKDDIYELDLEKEKLTLLCVPEQHQEKIINIMVECAISRKIIDSNNGYKYRKR